MKKKKLLICLLFVFLLSGCSVDYDIEIKDSAIKVNGKLVELDKNKWDDIIVDNSLGEEDVDVPIEDNEVYNGSFPVYHTVQLEFNRFSVYPYYICTDTFDSLDGTSNIPHCAINITSNTGYTIYNDFGNAKISVSFKGYLVDSCFSQLKAALGV